MRTNVPEDGLISLWFHCLHTNSRHTYLAVNFTYSIYFIHMKINFRSIQCTSSSWTKQKKLNQINNHEWVCCNWMSFLFVVILIVITIVPISNIYRAQAVQGSICLLNFALWYLFIFFKCTQSILFWNQIWQSELSTSTTLVSKQNLAIICYSVGSICIRNW